MAAGSTPVSSASVRDGTTTDSASTAIVAASLTASRSASAARPRCPPRRRRAARRRPPVESDHHAGAGLLDRSARLHPGSPTRERRGRHPVGGQRPGQGQWGLPRLPRARRHPRPPKARPGTAPGNPGSAHPWPPEVVSAPASSERPEMSSLVSSSRIRKPRAARTRCSSEPGPSTARRARSCRRRRGSLNRRAKSGSPPGGHRRGRRRAPCPKRPRSCSPPGSGVCWAGRRGSGSRGVDEGRSWASAEAAARRTRRCGRPTLAGDGDPGEQGDEEATHGGALRVSVCQTGSAGDGESGEQSGRGPRAPPR